MATSYTNSAISLDVTSPGQTDWNLQIKHSLPALSAGESYQVRMRVKSLGTEPESSLRYVLERGSDYSRPLGGSITASLGLDNELVTLYEPEVDFADDELRFFIALGGSLTHSGSRIMLDSVSFRQLRDFWGVDQSSELLLTDPSLWEAQAAGTAAWTTALGAGTGFTATVSQAGTAAADLSLSASISQPVLTSRLLRLQFDARASRGAFLQHAQVSIEDVNGNSVLLLPTALELYQHDSDMATYTYEFTSSSDYGAGELWVVLRFGGLSFTPENNRGLYVASLSLLTQNLPLGPCELGTHDCHPTLGVCTNSEDGLSFSCSCVLGTVGDGSSCLPPAPVCDRNDMNPELGSLLECSEDLYGVCTAACLPGKSFSSGSLEALCLPGGSYSDEPLVCSDCVPASMCELHHTFLATCAADVAVACQPCTVCGPGYTQGSACTLTADRTCMPRMDTCDAPKRPDSGRVVSCATYTGGACIVECDSGYAAEGDLVRTCQADGSYSGQPPKCSVCEASIQEQCAVTINEICARGSTYALSYDDSGRPLVGKGAAQWYEPEHDDYLWPRGPTPIGYEVSGATTVIPELTWEEERISSVLARFSFEISEYQLAGLEANTLTLQLDFDAGCVVWLNGVELASFDMGPAGLPRFAPMRAYRPNLGSGPRSKSLSLSRSTLRVGTNVLAAQVSQSFVNSAIFGQAGSASIQEELFFSASLSVQHDDLGLLELVPEEATWAYHEGLVDPTLGPVERVMEAKGLRMEDSDWIELHNSGGFPMPLSGWSLSDSSSSSSWFFPATTVLGADEYLLVLADGVRVTEYPVSHSLQYLHANFTLGKSDRLVLRNAQVYFLFIDYQ